MMIYRKNALKEKLRKEKRVFGTWSMLGSPSVTNVIGYAGLDFVIIDMEHGPVTFETVENQLYAAESTGCTPVVRLGELNEQSILHALDIGAQAILVSHVSSKEDAIRVVKAAKYFPEGERGLSPFTRNHGYSDTGLFEKLKYANEQTFIGVLVEGGDGINNLEEICKVKGLDMVYLGVYDISQFVGVSGDVWNSKVIEIIKDCVGIIDKHNLSAGSVARDQDYLKFLIDTGFKFISYRVDSAVLLEGFQNALKWFKEATGEQFR